MNEKSNIYTRTGDAGGTSLATGQKVSKASLRLEAYGSVDEANAQIGLIMSLSEDDSITELFAFVSHKLFNCSSNLATPGQGGELTPPQILDRDIAFIEKTIDRLDGECPPLTGFVLCGGTIMAARCHVARTVLRRAERAVVRLNEQESVDHMVLKFINRSSDLLFACSRFFNSTEGKGDVLWDKVAAPPEF